MNSRYQLVLLRHGESEWNRLNLFTGWRDVRLTEVGEQEAKAAGRTMTQEGLDFDCVFTSMLSRAIKTLWLSLEEMDRMWLPVVRHWRFNERHYGALQGMNKTEAVQRFGEEQVREWRRSYATPPPLVDPASPEFPGHDPRYAGVPPEELPRGESLKDVLERVLPFWNSEVEPKLREGQRVLIVAHGNSLRALMKHLEEISDEAIVNVNLATGVPRGYRLDRSGKAAEAAFLGNPDDIQAKITSVQNQTRRA